MSNTYIELFEFFIGSGGWDRCADVFFLAFIYIHHFCQQTLVDVLPTGSQGDGFHLLVRRRSRAELLSVLPAGRLCEDQLVAGGRSSFNGPKSFLKEKPKSSQNRGNTQEPFLFQETSHYSGWLSWQGGMLRMLVWAGLAEAILANFKLLQGCEGTGMTGSDTCLCLLPLGFG